ncbi:MAG: DNA polymerase III subunit gamma/tau [Planctomycetota bacterium]|nr:DNA polymerase III subunit gamma/tau [Planctomycetota bacterium]
MSDPAPTLNSTEGNRSGGDGRYQVIARRYRPRSFDAVVGQEAVSEAIRQAILQQRLAHAYLFCGPRGVGKTSMARIFAAALQCGEANEGDPCGECSTCQRIFIGEDSDVTELDGASHRGIDDIRSLIEHVQYAPTQGPYRIFIIDEVHMLTREAFNALLKTLEEPPAHVKFIFATTEPERVIPTVLSRCQRCDFRSISNSDIVRRLGQICEQEGVVPADGLLDGIASLARGGMRDAQSLLDQVLAFAGDHPGPEDLDRITGRVSQERLEGLLAAVDSEDLAAVIAALSPILGGGTEPSVLTEQIAEELRQRLHSGVSGGVSGDWGDKDLEANLLAQEILQETRQRLRRQDRGDLVLELALMRMTTLRGLVPLTASTAPVAVEPAVAPAPSLAPAPAPSPAPSSSAPSPVAEGQADTGPTTTDSRSVQSSTEESQIDDAAASTDGPDTTVSDAPESTLSAWEQLVDAFRQDEPILARRLTTEGKLECHDDQWQLQASEILKGELEQDRVSRVIAKWQQDHGPLTIMGPQASVSAGSHSDGDKEPPGDKPEIIQQAEEIFSSKARNRGPASGPSASGS